MSQLHSFARRVLVKAMPVARALLAALPSPLAYRLRAWSEALRFAGLTHVHDLPPMFHYWSGKYLRPMMEEMGLKSMDEFFSLNMKEASERAAKQNRLCHIVSLGSGNCETEIRLLALLKERGITNIHLTCLDLNGPMIERGKKAAMEAGLAQEMAFIVQDVTQWAPEKPVDAVLINQFLHHVEKLEDVLETIKENLRLDGTLIISDIVGRNGHMRWPEALQIVEEFWKRLPSSYKYNHVHGRTYDDFVNWDCSQTGFEGIRAQDIMPLLLERFHFSFFFAFGNLVNVFLERTYGPNFDVNNHSDCAFIDELHQRDQTAIEAGEITPTQILAVLSKERPQMRKIYKHLTPEFCVRDPNRAIHTAKAEP